MKYTYPANLTAYQTTLFDALNAVAETCPDDSCTDPDEIMRYALRLYNEFSPCLSPFANSPHALDEVVDDLRRQYDRLVRLDSPLRYLLRGIYGKPNPEYLALCVDPSVVRYEGLKEAESHIDEYSVEWQSELWYWLGITCTYGDPKYRSTTEAYACFGKGADAGHEKCKKQMALLAKKHRVDKTGKIHAGWGERFRAYIRKPAEESPARDANYRMLRLACLIVSVVASVYLGYRYITSDFDWMSLVNWNMFSSPFAGLLFIVSWFLYLPHWSWFEVKPYLVNKQTGEATPHHDVVDTAYGSILVPIVTNLLLAPLAIAAVLYYVLMGIFSIVVFLLPYLAAVLTILAGLWIYRSMGKLVRYNIRTFGCVVATLVYLTAVVWLALLV